MRVSLQYSDAAEMGERNVGTPVPQFMLICPDGSGVVARRGRQERMSFVEFCDMVRAGIARGEIKTTVELNDLDLAIQYAIGQEMQRCGGGLETTASELYYLIGKYCGEDVRNSLFSEAREVKKE